jgi:hypothetical protein
VSLRDDVRLLTEALGRSITVDGTPGVTWIVQKCPICDIELKLMNDGARQDQLYKELFSLYDGHRCHAVPDEVAYQRAERTFVRVSEAALVLAKRGDPLAQRAERESDRLAKVVETLGSREKIGA